MTILRRFKRVITICTVAGITVAVTTTPLETLAAGLNNTILTAPPLPTTPPPLVTTVTAADGSPIATLDAQYRLPLTSQQISPAMSNAIVAAEDRNYWRDGGINPTAMLRAGIHDINSADSIQGASTITQQYVKNYLINVVDRTNPPAQNSDQAATLSRKLREAKTAINLTHTMSKQDILTGYLNIVSFSDNIYGLSAAAAAYFNTTPDKLTTPQAALLAGMVNNPILYDPYQHPQHSQDRRNQVLDAMVQTHALTPQDAAAAKSQPLGVVPGGPTVPTSNCLGAAPDAGFFCQYTERYLEQAGFTPDRLTTGGYTIRTTMDPRVAQAVKDAVDHNAPPTQPGVANAMAVIAPGGTGHPVLAMVANRDYGLDPSHQTLTNIVADPANTFGAGSSFKIFTTAAALEHGTVGLSSTLPDPQTACVPAPGGGPCARVGNDGKYPPTITVANALATSPNTAFVTLESQVGMQPVVEMAYRLGLRDTLTTNAVGAAPVTDPTDPASRDPLYGQPQSQYFQDKLSFTLGVSPVSPLEMANVAATLKSGGTWCPPNPILSVTDRSGKPVPIPQTPCEQVLAPPVATTLLAGLSKDTVTGTSAAAARAAGWHRPDLGKTGTTEQSESVAYVGAVNGYAASSMVWADGSHPAELCPGPPVHLGSCGSGAFGGTVAAPPYFRAMNQLLAGEPNQPVPNPDPAYLAAHPHGPIVPFVVGQHSNDAVQAIQQAGYPVTVQPWPSAAPTGQIIAETPQGNAPSNTPVTLYASTGMLAPPAPS